MVEEEESGNEEQGREPRWWQVYARQEYMTPGVEETLKPCECGSRVWLT